MRDIKTPEDLNGLLATLGIKTDGWVGRVTDLYNEVTRGDCRLTIENGVLHRHVNGVVIKCFYTNREGERFQLREERQVFRNGQVRERGHLFVAEKLQFNESPEHGALRGLLEELQISGPDIKVTSHPEENKCDTIDSPTYPGIQSTYNTFVFYCEIPESHYRSSYVEVQEDKQTFFSWVKI